MTHNYLIADRSASRKGLPLAWRLPGMPGHKPASAPLLFVYASLVVLFCDASRGPIPRRRFPWSRWPGGQCTRRSSTRTYPANGDVGDAVISIDPETRSLIVIADEKTRQAISQVVC